MSNNCRQTRQRQIILEELHKFKSHPTAVEVYELVKMKLPNISLGTVYRNLEHLYKRGEINRLETAGRKMRFDADRAEHFHVRCTKCGKIEDLHDLSVEQIRNDVDKLSNFKITGLKLEFEGLCKKCK